MNTQPRKPTNLSLDASLLTEDKALKVNLSRAAEDGVCSAVAAAKAAQCIGVKTGIKAQPDL